MVKKVATVVLTVALCFVMACAPAAPTSTPTSQPTATPVEIRATKPEHLAGIWFDYASYQRWGEDGTITVAESMDTLDSDHVMTGRYWFEDGTFYMEPPVCLSLLVCNVRLHIEEGRAVRAYIRLIEEPDPPCPGYSRGTQWTLVRVD
jgi:hypothetical protein